MFTPKIRPLLTRVYYGALGGGLLSSSILFSNAHSTTTTTTTTTTTLTEKRIMAHCQDDSNQRRNNSSSCSSSGGENADHAVPILTKKTNHGHATVNEDEDELTRQGFDRSDFDIYLTRPTKEDLLPLLTEYTINNKNVWPWIWTWHNINGPHYVFVGTNPAINKRIEELASSSPRNNIIVITNNNSNNHADDNSSSSSSSSTGGNKHALTKDASYYYTNRCGIIENVTIREIDVTNKIILLSDERILCFTELYIV